MGNVTCVHRDENESQQFVDRIGMVPCAACVHRDEDESQQLAGQVQAMGEQIQQLQKELANEQAEFTARASGSSSDGFRDRLSLATSRFSCADVRPTVLEAQTQLVTVEPETGLLSFDLQPGIAQVQRSFRLINQSSQFVAFKVRTSSPNCYHVRPGSGTMAAGESRAVEVLLDLEVLLAQDGSLAAARKHRFSVRVAGACSPHALTAEQWAAVPTEFLQEQRLKVDVTEADTELSSAGSSHGNTARGSPAVPPRIPSGGLTPMLRTSSSNLLTPHSSSLLTPRSAGSIGLMTPRSTGSGLSSSPPSSGQLMAQT